MGASIGMIAPGRGEEFPCSYRFLPAFPFEVASEEIQEVWFLFRFNRAARLVCAIFVAVDKAGKRNRFMSWRRCGGKSLCQCGTATEASSN